MRTLCASTLIGEFFVIGFAGLVAMKVSGLSMGTVWTVCGISMAVCVLLCGMLSRPGAVQIGWALQIGLVLSGFVVTTMFILGVVFAALWWASVHFGRCVTWPEITHVASAAQLHPHATSQRSPHREPAHARPSQARRRTTRTGGRDSRPDRAEGGLDDLRPGAAPAGP
jgi:hypothetical protein